MIPLRLTLKNFLSYGAESQVVDFGPYHMICLSGKNGHGKSALLDAITWAIWGQARKIAGTPKADQGLVRIGAKSMLVSLDFICNGKIYRIKRECVLTSGKPISWLDFGLLDTTDNSVTSLSEKTIRETQAVIEKTLGLTYDTFINSAFLRQGNANEFSKKTAKERKEIVASILGLDFFEALRKEALTQTRILTQEIEAKNALIARIQLDIEREPSIKEQSSALECAYEEVQKNSIAAEQVIQQLQVQHAHITQCAGMQDYWRNIKAAAELKMTALWAELVKAQQAIRQLKHMSSSQPAQEKENEQTLRETIKQLEQRFAVCSQAQEKLVELQQQKHTLEQDLLKKWQCAHDLVTADSQKAQMHLQKVKAEHALIEIQKTKLELESAQIQKQVDEVLAQEPVLHAQCEQLKSAPVLLDKYRSFYQRMNAYRASLTQQGHSAFIPAAAAQKACPTCLQPITEITQQLLIRRSFLCKKRSERIAHFLTGIAQQGKVLQEKSEQFKKQELQIVQIAQTKEQLQARFSTLQQEVGHVTKQLAQLDLQQAEAHCLKAAQLVDESLHKKNQLEQDQTLQQISEHIGSYQEQSGSVKTVLEDLTRKKEQLQMLQATQTEEGRHYLAEQVLLLKRQRATIITELKELRVSCRNASLQEEVAYKAALEKKKLEEQLHHEKLMLQSIVAKQRELVEQRGRINQELSMIQRSRAEQGVLMKAQTDLKIDADEYKNIAQALSKEGIQALLIEDAIPELEAEANALLARLTDNAAQIFIESLRDLKNGGVKETLDIKISDSVGIRPYEMFSGGEAFRIDFALRIALSKLLARRAGTSLQTLIIDEGFGSQDDEGLLQIMDALYKIQEDFSKIIIVSHLPSMKDQFPVHFVVQKGADGSTVSVVEQG